MNAAPRVSTATAPRILPIQSHRLAEIALARHYPIVTCVSKYYYPHSCLRIKFHNPGESMNYGEINDFINNLRKHGAVLSNIGSNQCEVKLIGGRFSDHRVIIDIMGSTHGLFVWDKPGALIALWETDAEFNQILAGAGLVYQTYIPEGMASCCHYQHTDLAVTTRYLHVNRTQ